ncbi:MAG: hypothetical protein ACXWKM_07185 [Phenylobacterium sp.]
MDLWISLQNLELFKRRLADERDPHKRDFLQGLIAQEEANFCNLRSQRDAEARRGGRDRAR